MNCLWLLFFAGAWAVKDCGKPCDIMLVIDRSGSIKKFGLNGVSGGDREEEFVRKMVNDLTQHYQEANIGFISYSTNTNSKYGTMTTDKLAMAQAINDLPPTSGITRTDKAIQIANDFQARGRRPGVACARMYVITDGKTNPPSYKAHTQAAAKEARDNGVEVFSIGVGTGIDMAELKGIASDPDNDHVFAADDFDALFDKIHAKEICAQEYKCVMPPTVNGHSGSWNCGSPSGPYDHQTQCTLTCHTGSYDAGLDGKTTCDNGTWVGNDEVCKAADCPVPPVPQVSGGTWICPPGTTVPHRGACLLSCQHGMKSGDGLVMCQEGQWSDQVPDACNVPGCPKNTYTFGGSSYSFTPERSTYNAAAMTAKRMGGHLVAITSAAEQDFIDQQVLSGSNKDQPYWTGASSDANLPPTWSWANSAPLTFINWELSFSAFNEPNHNGVMNQEYTLTNNPVWLGKWNAEPGDSNEQYCGLIEIPPPLYCKCDITQAQHSGSCAPDDCSTARGSNMWNFIMCIFDMDREFGPGKWSETSPNRYKGVSANGKTGFVCVPLDPAQIPSSGC